MKIKTLFLAFALTSLVSVQAQTTNVPPTGISDLGQTILGYFTSFNTNLDSTFGGTRADIWVGVSSIQNAPQNVQNDIGVSYDIWRPTPGTNVAVQCAVSLENVLRNSGVVGTLQSENFGVGFSFIIHDTKLTIYGDCAYDLWNTTAPTGDRFYGEVGLRAKKALGSHFYSGVGLGAQFPKNAQVFSAFGGVTF